MSDPEGWNGSRGIGTYEETIFSRGITLILGVTTAVFFLLWIYESFFGWGWSEPFQRWIWLGMFLFFLGMTVNFSKLSVKMSSDSLTVGYGIIKKKIPWGKVEDCYVDEDSALSYGGWGIRFTRVRGKWRTVYNVIGGPRVVVTLNEGFVDEIAFSTKKPEKAIKTIKENIGG